MKQFKLKPLTHGMNFTAPANLPANELEEFPFKHHSTLDYHLRSPLRKQNKMQNGLAGKISNEESSIGILSEVAELASR